ncbi:MAG TPA: class I SAM-dependent methyltransferase [Kribbellaceae bacterium]|nr:class I SAM-dependent methyltransferase [Kribbellaceae bacterium]
MSDEQVDWVRYLRDFHAADPGVTEAVLSRATAGDHTPYRWLCRAVSTDPKRVLDVACGNGAVARRLASDGHWVVGVDVSAAELALAPRPAVRADATQLPFGDGSFDVVTCSLGLAVAHPLTVVLAEIARVLRAGGVLAATVPAVRPVRRTDLPVLTGLAARLRGGPQFPGGGELTGLRDELVAAGFAVLESQRERYGYPVRDEADADLLVRCLYLPGTGQGRRDAAVAWLSERAASKGEFEVAIPIRRIVAMRSGS